MTISTTTNKNIYTADGVQTTFQYTFKIFDASHLEVILEDTNGNETVQTINVDYTVTGVGNAAGGDVVFTAAPTNGYKVVIHRVPPLTQETDYINNQVINIETLEQDLDKIVTIAQYLKETIDRSLLRNTSASSSLTFPSLSSGKYLTNDGTSLQWSTPTNATYNGTISVGTDAGKPASPSENDIYFAKDTGILYLATSSGVWTPINIQRGNDADKPASPKVKDAYLAVDTGKLYFCKTAGSWTVYLPDKIQDSDGNTYISTTDVADEIVAKVNNTTAFKIYSSGIIDLPKQSVIRVHLGTSQSIPHDSNTKIQFDSEDIDLQNEFDNTTNYRFTATKAGIYRVSLTVRYSAYDNYMYAILYKNGSEYSKSMSAVGGAISFAASAVLNDIIQLNANDYLEFYTYHQGLGDPKSLEANTTFASIEKIS
ncbi:MAG: hypothetical protein KatS3mg087_1649 [Patescibacteria group bacterium]|nr:MAG: hypothetical protein KatS3mg087_1649 [Patescibacteria group bacterium]